MKALVNFSVKHSSEYLLRRLVGICDRISLNSVEVLLPSASLPSPTKEIIWWIFFVSKRSLLLSHNVDMLSILPP